MDLAWTISELRLTPILFDIKVLSIWVGHILDRFLKIDRLRCVAMVDLAFVAGISLANILDLGPHPILDFQKDYPLILYKWPSPATILLRLQPTRVWTQHEQTWRNINFLGQCVQRPSNFNQKAHGKEVIDNRKTVFFLVDGFKKSLYSPTKSIYVDFPNGPGKGYCGMEMKLNHFCRRSTFVKKLDLDEAN